MQNKNFFSSFAISVLQIFCKNTNGQTRWNSLTEEEDKCLHNQEGGLAQGLSGTKPPQSLAEATAKLGFRNANCRCHIFLNVLGFYQFNLSFPIETQKPKSRIKVAERNDRNYRYFSVICWGCKVFVWVCNVEEHRKGVLYMEGWGCNPVVFYLRLCLELKN